MDSRHDYLWCNKKSRKDNDMKKSKVATAKSIETRIIKYMKSLGTYKVEFSDMIKIYADMLRQS